MKTTYLRLALLIFAGSILSTPLFSQGVAINTSGNPADASAMLDVQSTSGGILIPRLSFVQRGNLVAPANGLLIYQTDNQPGFYYYNGTVWTKISTGLDVSGTQNYVSKFTGANSLGNSQIFDNGTNVGIGTATPSYKLHVAGNGYFTNGSNSSYLADVPNGRGVYGIGTSAGIYGEGGTYGVIGTGTNTGVYGVSTNIGIYGTGSAWAGFFNGYVHVSAYLGLGTVSPTAQLHTTGTVRFANYTNGFLRVDANGNLGVSVASSLFTAGTGLSWSGSTLNSVWSVNGNDIYNNNTSNVGIGTNSPVAKLDVSGGNIRTTNQLVSTQATGTAPLSVTSTTMVTNLNTDLLDGYHAGNASGNIPVSNATLNTNLNADLLDGNHASAFAAASHTHAASDVTSGEFDRARVRRMISADTRATNPNPDTYEPALQADFKQNTTDGLSDGGTYHGVLSFRPYGTGTDYSGGPMHQLGFTQNGNLWIRTSTGTTTWSSWKPVLSSTNISGTTNYVSKFTGANSIGNSQIFDNGTNVGVGFASPTYKLDVQGASGIRIGNTTYDANLVFGNNATWKSGIRVYDNGDAEMRIWHANANGQIVLATGYNGDQASTMPADGLFIDQNKVGIGYASPAAATGKLLVNGNVGIGTTTPGSPLHVGTTGWSANQLHFSSGWTTGGYHATIGSGYSGISASGIMLGTPHVPWRASYGAKLRIAGDQAATNYWDLGMNGEAGGSTDRFDVNRNNTNLFTITNAGRVGVGNAAPAVKLDVNGTAKANAFSQNNNGLRITAPDGASYVTATSSVTGAIKITLPQYRSSTMMRMTVKIYQYTTDQSYTIELGGYNYSGGSWYNTFANVTTTSGAALNVRFGYDASSKNCIWIGETSSTWSYPQVFVTDFQAGFSNYTTDQWDDGWAVTFETSFGTVETVANTTNSSNNSYIKNGTASQSANFNITGYGYAGNYFQTPTLYVSGYRHTASTYENVYSDNNSSGGFHLYRNDGNSWGYFYADNGGIGILKDGSWAVRATGGVGGTNTDVSFFTDGGAQRAYFNSAGLYFTMANPQLNASSYFIAPGGAYFNSGTVYTEAQYQCRGGIHNDAAGDLTIAGGTNGTTYFSGPISGMSGTMPSNYMVRLTPNLHLNAGTGYAVIANWDNGTTGSSLAFRIGNGAGADVFDVLANGNLGIGTTSPSYKIHVNGGTTYNYLNSNQYSYLGYDTYYTNYAYHYGPGASSSSTTWAGYYYANLYYYTGSGSYNNMAGGVRGYVLWGREYSAGVQGWNYGDNNRSAGVQGYNYAGSGAWGALGYKNSGGTNYGLYYTSAGSGSGFMANEGIQTSIGSGGYGGVMGGWSRGEVLGFTTAGELYASYNLGNEYTSGVSADIVTVNDERIPAYSVTSNEIKVYSDGVAVLNNGYCKVFFDASFASLISGGKRPTVTVSPMGESEGIYIVSIDKEGFVVKESHGGQSNVEFTWIAVGLRTDANSVGKVPDAITDRNFDQNLKGVMFNENDKDNSATPIWWDGNNLRFDKMPETPVNKPKEDPNMPANNNSDDVNRLIQQNNQPQPENKEWRPSPEQPVRNQEKK